MTPPPSDAATQESAEEQESYNTNRREYLKLAGVATASALGIGAQSDVASAATTGYGEGGYGEGPYGGEDGVVVSTKTPSGVDTTSATLYGSLDDLGGASSADVYFEYRQTGASSWNTTAKRTLSSTGSFSDSISGLEDGVDYEYRAVASASDGDTDTGSNVTFTTTDDPPAVSTGSASGVGETSATLNGSLDDLGGAASVDVYFEYREAGTSTWNQSSAQTLSSTGTFSQEVSGLSAGVDYEYRAVANASDSDTDTGSQVTFTIASDTLSVTTDAASNVGETRATLNGTLNDLGGASSVNAYFEYRQTGSSTWSQSGAQTLSSTGAYSANVTDLEDGVEYEYRAVVDASDGDSDTGGIVTFTTTDDPPAVSTGSPSGVGETSTTLNGSLDDLGGAASVDVYFEYRQTGASSWNTTVKQTLSSTGTFSEDVTDLSSGTEYEFRSTGTSSDGDSDTGSTVSSTTSTANSAPSIDTYSVTEAGSPNPHCEITADWSVSDGDGNLDAVEVAVFDSSGVVVDAAKTNVSGSSASGRNEFKIKHVGGQTFDVTVNVTDTKGDTDTATQSVTE